jgi:hypothetical protein
MSGVGPLKARIVVKDRQITNLSTGSGSVSTSVNGNGIHISVNGHHYDSADVIGPYVVTNETPDGSLIRRDITSEDEALVAQQQQAMTQSFNNMNQQFANNWNSFGSGFGMQPMAPMMFGR